MDPGRLELKLEQFRYPWQGGQAAATRFKAVSRLQGCANRANQQSPGAEAAGCSSFKLHQHVSRLDEMRQPAVSKRIERRFWHSSRNTSEILSFKPYIEPAAVSLPLARGASCMLHTCDLEPRDPIEPRLVNLARCGPWPPVAEAAAVLQPLERGATFRGCFKVGRNG